MNVYMILTATGSEVVLTSYQSPTHPDLVTKLADKGIRKYVAYEIPVDMARERYGNHFMVVEHDSHDDDFLRILDEDGSRAFKLFRFSEMGTPVHWE
ncbi:MAG: cytosolic protein [Alphaproteobacteria bacterium]